MKVYTHDLKCVGFTNVYVGLVATKLIAFNQVWNIDRLYDWEIHRDVSIVVLEIDGPSPEHLPYWRPVR